jgi:DNA-binding MarR family transcriptional regulator
LSPADAAALRAYADAAQKLLSWSLDQVAAPAGDSLSSFYFRHNGKKLLDSIRECRVPAIRAGIRAGETHEAMAALFDACYNLCGEFLRTERQNLKTAYDRLEAELLPHLQTLEDLAEDRQREPALGERHHDVLDHLYDKKAFAPDTRVTTESIAEGVGLDPAALKEPVADLSKRGLVSTKRGRSGGVWLAPAGRRLVERQRKR